MMRLQRVGRKNDPSYRIVVTDKRSGPKSNKHVAILGSYNPKMDHVQLDTAAAKEWLAKGVQPSDTVHNILVAQGVIEGKKINVLPKKSPIVSDTPEEEATEAGAAEDGGADEAPAEEAPAEESAETPEETPAEEPAAEETAEAPAQEEAADEAPAEEAKEEEAPAEESEDAEPEAESSEEEKKD